MGIGKVLSKRKKKTSNKSSKLTIYRIVLISSFSVLIIGITFTLIQFLGETFGFLPPLQLGDLNWGLSGDPIIVFVIGFLFSIFIGSIVVLLVIRNQINK